uniref:Ig-like domain-containing protein n=1 Tax=Denticeps clupeoides TaxID=299321 RepID=A0AAY4EH47_9TELE
MGNLILAALLMAVLPTGLRSIQVIVPETQRSTTLFASVILRCDYSTSANQQDVLVTWKYKSFCKDPVLEYYSTAYQAALALGQDPANDCPDRQRTVRVVIQKRGISEPILGSEYRERKITILNKADLSITEVMWWDNGMYFCSIDATGDTVGDSDKEIRLVVYHWLVVLLIILGALALIMLVCICCCQCCPQNCCCYVRCPCCPRTCCCPEKAMMQQRMMKQAKKAMSPWMLGQPIYAPVSNGSSQANYPLLYSGSVGEYPTKQALPMTNMAPMALPPLYHTPPPVLTHGIPAHGSLHGSGRGSGQGRSHMLDFLENQVRGIDMAVPLQQVQPLNMPPPLQPLPVQYSAPPPQAIHQGVPFSAGPPSMLSALGEIGVRGVERRVIQLPPIVGRAVSANSRRGSRGARDRPRQSSQSSGSSNRNGPHRSSQGGHRDPLPGRRGILRSYSDESDRDDLRGARGGGGGRERHPPQSKRELIEELQRHAPRRERSYSPPNRHRSWSSEDEDSQRRSEKPPSYSSIEIKAGQSVRNNYRYSVHV